MKFKVTIETEEGRKRSVERFMTCDVVMIATNKKDIEELLIRQAKNAAAYCMRQLFEPFTIEELQKQSLDIKKKSENS